MRLSSQQISSLNQFMAILVTRSVITDAGTGFSTMVTNKRASPRKAQGYGARLYSAINGSLIDCVLKDISATGACVRLPSDLPYFSVQWPRQLILQIPTDRVEIDCILVRRTRSEMAVQFASPFRAIMAA